MCTYHGWTYDLKGALVGVPGFKEVYHEELDRENWGLIKAAQVDSYKGFVFATMDPTAPTLYDYLAEGGRFGMDLIADQGDMVIMGGVEKRTMQANWKFPTDNTADFYHSVTHVSAHLTTADQPRWARRAQNVRVKRAGDNGRQRPGYAVLSEYGHVAGMSMVGENWREDLKDQENESWRFNEETQRKLGPIKGRAAACMTNIFPNLFVPMSARQIGIRMPKGPTTSEIWYFSFVGKDWQEEMQQNVKFRATHTFAAAGMWEQDDGENWEQSTRGVRGTVSSRYPLNYSMNVGRGELLSNENGPNYIPDFVNENYQLWQYRAWAELMASDTWDDWKRNHAIPEGTV
jgi:phenylpropionate dioxygenase-like ring-hydroxylating dioxygenase large terminal subunit